MKLHPQPMYWQFCKELTFKVEMTFDQNNLNLKNGPTLTYVLKSHAKCQIFEYLT